MKNVMVIPELTLDDARRAIDFYQRAFGAKDLGTHATPDGSKIMHSGLEVNGGVIFVCDDFPERSGGQRRSPRALGGSPVTIHLNCADVHAAWNRAVKAGARVLMPLEQQFWGDVYGVLEDPFGQRWSMSAGDHEKPDVEADEYKSGAEKLYPTRPPAKAGAKAPAKSPSRSAAKSGPKPTARPKAQVATKAGRLAKTKKRK